MPVIRLEFWMIFLQCAGIFVMLYWYLSSY